MVLKIHCEIRRLIAAVNRELRRLKTETKQPEGVQWIVDADAISML